MDKKKKERSGLNFLIKTSPRHRKSFKSLSGMPNLTEHERIRPINSVPVGIKVDNRSLSNEDDEDDTGLRRIARSWTSDDPSYLRNQAALSITEMRRKYSRTASVSKVPVKEKVALMESWGRATRAQKPKVPARRSTSSNSGVQRPPPFSPSKVHIRDPPKPVIEITPSAAKHPPLKPRRSAREAKHRRSMSDPNLQKSFQAMKELWDKKVQQQSDTSAISQKSNWPPKLRGNSLTSSNSADNDINEKQSKDPVHTTVNKENLRKEKRPGPPTPTKPKPSTLRLTEEYPRDPRKKASSFTTQLAVTTPSSVKNRARMFDVPGDNNTSKDISSSSLNRSKNRPATIAGDDSGSYRSAKKQDSPRRLVNNNDKPGKDNSKLESVCLLDYDETAGIRTDNDDPLIRNIRRNSANTAKERRRLARCGSSHSDSDSNCSGTSSLSSTSVEGPVVLRRHPVRDEISPVTHQPKPVVKSYLHRNASPKTSRPENPVQAITPKASPRSGSIGSRTNRSGSLGNIAQTPPHSNSPQPSSRRKSSLHKDHSSSSISDDLESPTAVLNHRLSVGAAKRVSASTDSGTGTNRNSSTSEKYYSGNLDGIMSSGENFKRGGSFSSIASLNKTPPPPPPSSDKPSRGRSSSSAALMPPVVIRPNVPPPPPPANHNRSKSGSVLEKKDESGMGSTTTISSRMSFLSGIGDGTFNAEEEYNRILDVISTPTSSKRYRNSTSSSQADDWLSISTEQDESSSGNRDSLEVPSRKSRASDNDSYSDFEPSDVEEDESQMSLNVSSNQQNPDESTPVKVPVEVKLHNIAKELLATETTYVDVLHLIDQIFHKRVLDAVSKKQIPSDVKNIFSNVSAIYQFHSGFLLPQLKARLDCWEASPKIGDILRQAAPFLKMYSLYVQNFHEAMTMIKHWSEKSHNFANIIKQTQAMEECGNLSLEHHMLGPVQRIPRYKMLLEDYLKRLPEDSPDRPETSTALDLISKAADHTNESMRQNDKFNRMLSIYNNLVDINFDIVNVSRELIMEGKIIKISARNGEKHERYLYLFNDMLLCCTPLRRLQKKSYKITAKIDLDGMEIKGVTNMNIPNTFCVNGTNKSMEFAANTPEEKEKWINAGNDAIEAYLERKTSFMKSGSQRIKAGGVVEEITPDSPLHQSDSYTQLNSPLRTPTNKAISFEEFDSASGDEKRIEISCNPGTGSTYVVDIEDHDLGKRAPRWIKDNEVTMCMHCSKAFNRLLRRRHHCRACGRVICTECSEHKLELAYEPGKSLKVCNKCHATLTGRKGTDGGDKKGVLQIKADVVSKDGVISEYLYFSESDKRKAWTKMWCVIPKEELCLYVYGANQDVRAAMTMPLIGFTIVEDNTIDREFAFKLVQGPKTLWFAATSVEQKNRWKYVFQRVTQGEKVEREDVYNCNPEKVNEQLLEPASRASMNLTGLAQNGSSRLSSSSGESSNTSAYTPSDSSSRPTSLMGVNANVYESIEDGIQEKFDEAFQTNDSS